MPMSRLIHIPHKLTQSQSAGDDIDRRNSEKDIDVEVLLHPMSTRHAVSQMQLGMAPAHCTCGVWIRPSI